MNEVKIKNAIKEDLQGTCYYLFETVIRGSRNLPVIEIYVDTEDGITLKECANLCRTIGEKLDEDDNGLVKYRLDISSPGVDRGLKYQWQYKRNIGRELEISYQENDQTCSVTGELKDVNDNKIFLLNKKEEKEILLNTIKTAKVKTKW